MCEKDIGDGTTKKIEVCYTCGKEFDMNADELAHYHYDEFPMCGYCTNFFGFYKEDMYKKEDK